MRTRWSPVEVELREEIQQLARDMIRFEAWIDAAAEIRQFARAAELDEQRELVAERRSRLMRELWGQ